MRSFKPRRQAVVADAIVDVVHDSILHIRPMSHRRESMCDDFFPGHYYQQQIRELADLCDNLVPGLRLRGRRRLLDALQFVWDSRSEQQQDWIRHCLAARDIHVDDLIMTASDRTRVMPN